VREMIEDQDRTKELGDAIVQGHTYGMQTFDQSVMMLYSTKLITYKEALRQASNPDDFALRVSGVAGTSDTSWDNFETGPAKPATPNNARPPLSSPATPSAVRPGAPTTPASAPKADDDFKIERF